MIGAFTTACRALSLCLGVGLCFGGEQAGPAQDVAASQKTEVPAGPLWQRAVDASSPLRIAIGATHLFVAGHGPAIEALSVADGEPAWALRADASVDLAAGAGLLFAIEPTRLQVLDQTTGAVRWALDPLPEANSIVSSFDAGVTIASGRYVLHLTVEEGRQVWSHAFPTAVRFLVSGAEGVVVVLADNTVYLLDAGSGRARSEIHLPADVLAVTLAEGRIYLAGADKALYGYGATDGGLHWRFGLPALLAGPPVVDDRQVYIALLDNTLRALDRSDGARHWWRALSARPAAGPTLMGGDLFVPLTSGVVSRSQTSGTGALARIPPPAQGTVQDAVRLEGGGVLPDGKTVFMVTRGLDNVRRLAVWPRS